MPQSLQWMQLLGLNLNLSLNLGLGLGLGRKKRRDLFLLHRLLHPTGGCGWYSCC
jgi:hypothetical protein